MCCTLLGMVLDSALYRPYIRGGGGYNRMYFLDYGYMGHIKNWGVSGGGTYKRQLMVWPLRGKVGKSFSSLRCLRQVNVFFDRYWLILPTELRCENRFCLQKRVSRRTGKTLKLSGKGLFLWTLAGCGKARNLLRLWITLETMSTTELGSNVEV